MQLLTTALVALAGLCGAQPSNCRFYMADQHDWGRQRGFYLDLEGSKLAELPLILGVGDGTHWRFLFHRPGFVPHRDYHVRALIGPRHAELFLDGESVGVSPGAWEPAAVPLAGNYRPSWALERGDWIAIMSSLAVTVERPGEEPRRREWDFSSIASRPVALQLFEEGQPLSEPLDTRPGDTLTVELTLRFAIADLEAWAPLVDRYGQCRYAESPGKVMSDEELQGDIGREDERLAQMPPSPDFDVYGGYLRAGWSEEATGFYRLIRRHGYWWLVTPEGNPCFFTGVCGGTMLTWETTPVSGRESLFEWLPPREGPFSRAWATNCWGEGGDTAYACFYTCNLIRKYGFDAWAEQATLRCLRRWDAWGRSPLAAAQAPGRAEAAVLNLGATPRLARHPDVFDPAVCEILRRELERQIAPRREDPLVLGWSIGNEFDEIITPDEVRHVLGMGAHVAAKRALVNHALAILYEGSAERMAQAWGVEPADLDGLYSAAPSPPDSDVEALRRFYAARYYETLYRTVKEIDPNHLYLGFWIVPGWWVNEEDWRLIAPYCDVIGYDRYARSFADDLLLRLKTETDKPILCGEFSLPAWYGGLRGFGRYPCWTEDDAHSGELYLGWVQDAARDPHCVGLIWFLFRDQPITGRGPGRGMAAFHGEHYAFGLVTETDRPKWPLVERVREANHLAPVWRMEASTRDGQM